MCAIAQMPPSLPARIIPNPGAFPVPHATRPEKKHKMMTTKHKEYCKSATRAGLHYVTDGFAGISRRRSGKGWSYFDEDGARIAEPDTRQRLNALAIPPAWIDVWICPDPEGHIQVTARDARGRKQYRYHASYRAARDQSKFRRMFEFSEILPLLRERVERDLRAAEQSRRQLLAAVVRLLDRTLIRVGNDEYARDNHSYGLTTMRSKHAQVEGTQLNFSFRGKSGVEHSVTLDDPRIARIVQRSLEMHGQEIFQYVDADGKRRLLLADDVNEYLRKASGHDITAKDFRTWGGTMVAAVTLHALGPAASLLEAKHNIVLALDAVAERLGNTRAVCRKYYVHPALLIAYHLGLTAPLVLATEKRDGSCEQTPAALRRDEVVVLQFLHESEWG
jgi:DNA topoisomerase-1